MNDLLIFMLITALLWCLVTLYWIGSALTARKGHAGHEIFSFVKLMGSAIVIYLPLCFPGTVITRTFYPPSAAAGISGVTLCFAGLALMIWARICLGRNWSGKVILQPGHTVSKNGPYRYIRHPIYGGGLLAMLGTAWVTGYVWGFVWFIFCAFGLNRKLRREEALLIRQFPVDYATYQRQTKKLIPFIW